MHYKRHQKTIIWAIVLAFLIGGVGLIGLERSGVLQNKTSTKKQTDTAATVGGTRITLAQLDAATTSTKNQYLQYYEQLGQDTSYMVSGASGAMFTLQMEAQALRGLVQQALYTQEADRRKIRVPESTVTNAFNSQYNTLLQNYQITEATLTEYLVAQGTTLAAWKAQMRDNVALNLRIQALRDAVVTPLVPTDEELMAYFEQNASVYGTQEQVRASHILVPERAKAEAILAQLKSGADFATLAQENSTDTGSATNGGDLGWFTRGQMVAEFETAAFALAVGETSDIVQTQYGYHIIRVTDRKVGTSPNFAEAKDKVKTDYLKSKQDQEFSDWSQKIYAQASAQIQLPLLQAVVDGQTNVDKGLSQLEQLRSQGTSDDRYLPYYIGRTYEQKVTTAASEKSTLDSKEVKTPDDTARIDALTKEIADFRAKALAAYLEAVSQVDPDESFLNRILALSPDSVTAIYLYGKLLLERGDPFGADLKFHDVIAKDPSYTAAYVGAGDVAVAQKAYDVAADQYLLALKTKPNDVTTMLKLFGVYLGAGRLDDADGVLSQVEKLDPQNPKLAMSQGDVASARLTAAVAEQKTLQAKSNRTAAEDTRLKDLATQISSQYSVAVDRYQKALTAGAAVDVYQKLGRVYAAAGDLEKAQKSFEDVIVRSPYRVEAYEGLADVLLQRGDTTKALENYRNAFSRSLDDAQKQQLGEKVVALAPTDLDMRMKLAKVYAKQYMWSAAIKQYAAILDSKPDTIEAYTGIADAYSMRIEYDTALDYLRRGITNASTDAAKITLYNQIVTISQKQAGEGKPLTTAGLDASLGLAKIYIAQGRNPLAKEKLDAIAKDAPTYHKDEVAALLAQVGGSTAPSGSTPSGSPQTP